MSQASGRSSEVGGLLLGALRCPCATRRGERLWCLHDDYRTDAEETVVIQLDEPITKRESAVRGTAPPASISARPPTPPSMPPRALDVPPPVVPAPDPAARSPRATLPPLPQPRLRSPLAAHAGAGAELARRAAALTSFPLQHDDGGPTPALGHAWEDVERSSLSTTLPGVGSHG
ncbi:uncharacterized protein SOCEGT47_014130 [Sorangium cellulosum]|uniref:Uncharacterized protein n=1 Tax=Sorangium cellulosum TaxID=56 RepID=A0A4P2PWP8_SORCE|nr:uncharacterized protein SOCEGT47_014130 [Sorangium cellulosum]